MTDTPTTPREPLAPFNVDKPIWLVVDRTGHKTYVETFTGWDAEREAKDYAAKRAAKTGREVILFGPQVAVARPPVPMAVGTVVPVRLMQPGDAG